MDEETLVQSNDEVQAEESKSSCPFALANDYTSKSNANESSTDKFQSPTRTADLKSSRFSNTLRSTSRKKKLSSPRKTTDRIRGLIHKAKTRNVSDFQNDDLVQNTNYLREGKATLT